MTDPSSLPPITPDTMVFQFIFDDILQNIQTYTATTSGSMMAVVGPVAGTLFGTYLLMYFYAVINGQISAPIQDFYRRAMRGTIIILFATTAGLYNDMVSSVVWEIPGAIAAQVSSPGSSTTSVTPNQQSSVMLDRALGSGLEAGQAAWDKMSMLKVGASFGYGCIAVLTWIVTVLVVSYAAVLVLIANLGTAVMLGLGPLFIMLCMFESTTPFFTAWVRQITTFMILFLVLSSIITLMFSFYVPFIKSIATMPADAMIIGFVKMVAVSAVAILVLQQSQSWASGLAGGVSIVAAGAIGRAVGGAAHNVAHTHYNPNKLNKDGTRGGHQLRGAVPSTVNAGVSAGKAVARAWQRRNSIKQD